MMKRIVVIASSAVLTMVTVWAAPFAAFAVTPAAAVDSALVAAASAWRQGELQRATEILNEAIAGESRDARLWYLRGIVSEQSGQDGTADFRTAARMEVAYATQRANDALIERLQGPVRIRIERARSEARAELSADPVRAMQALSYRDAVTAQNEGRHDDAMTLLDQVIDVGTTDARHYYMKGVVLAKAGDIEQARTLFQQGMSLETTAEDVRAVDNALSQVQGDIRQIIETQVLVGEGDQARSRQDIVREVRARAAELNEQLLAADDARRAELMEAAHQAEALRAKSAAELFLTQQKAAAEMAARDAALLEPGIKPEVSTTAPAGSAPIAAVQPSPASPTTPPASTGNPFGGTTSARPTSPFPTTPPTSNYTATPVDYSWLPPDMEFLIVSHPKAMIDSQFMQPIFSNPLVSMAVEQSSGQTGIKPSDVEWMTFGFGNVLPAIQSAIEDSEGNDGMQAALTELGTSLAASESFVGVARTIADVDPQAIIDATGASSSEYAGKTIYTFTPQNAPADAPEQAMCLLDPRTVLNGSVDGVRAALDRGPGSGLSPRFAAIPVTQQTVLILASPVLTELSSRIPPPGANAPPYVADFADAVRGKVSHVVVTIDAGADLVATVAVGLTDSGAAASLTTAFQAGAADAQRNFEFAKQQIPAPLQDPAQATIDSMKVSGETNGATVTITVPNSLVTAVMSNLFTLMQSMGGSAQ